MRNAMSTKDKQWNIYIAPFDQSNLSTLELIVFALFLDITLGVVEYLLNKNNYKD